MIIMEIVYGDSVEEWSDNFKEDFMVKPVWRFSGVLLDNAW